MKENEQMWIHTGNPRQFLWFTVVVVTFSSKSSTISMIVFRNVSLSRRKSTTRFAGSRFFRREVTLFIGHETTTHILQTKINEKKKSLRSADLTTIVLLEYYNHSTTTTPPPPQHTTTRLTTTRQTTPQNTCSNSFCVRRVICYSTNGPRPVCSGFQGKSDFCVQREPTKRVNIVSESKEKRVVTEKRERDRHVKRDRMKRERQTCEER